VNPLIKWICRPEGCVAISRAGWRLVRAWRPRGELLAHLAGKLSAVRSPRSRNPAKCSTSSASIPDDDPWLSPGLPERAADVAQNPAVRARLRVHAARRCLMRIPGASRSAGRGRPSPDSGPAPATCLPGCAWRAISLPGSTLGAALRHRGRPPIPSIECCRIHPGRFLTGARLAKTAEDHSERCCGIPASSARTSVSR
jgi:hypothetical protein